VTVRVLAGDIGGTKVLLRCSDVAGTAHRLVAEHRFESADYDGLLAMVREFQRLTGISSFEAACFGVAGPIGADGKTARLTNLPWVIDSDALARELSIPRVRLLNDFQAVGCSIEALTADDLVVLQAGDSAPRTNRALIGAGTGLGQGLLIWIGQYYEAIPSEGGHVDFAPTDEVQVDLLRFLRQQYGRVSYERVLSGAGLVQLYRFFRQRGVAGSLDAADPEAAPARVTTAALAETDPAAVAALRIFVSIYGAQAGNVALATLALGGVYIAGGIAPKILPALHEGTFMRAFLDKGRYTELLKRVPVCVITNERAGLLGAALVASRMR
jgi:glucokinase